MIMAGTYYFPDTLPMEKRIPFRDVYFTGMVRDKQGRKMSKSLGNSPDLLDLIDKYGADAVRFGILISSPAGNDLLFDEGALEQGRNFNNKLWNALKLVKMWEGRLTGDVTSTTEIPEPSSFAVSWMDNRIREARVSLDTLFTEFKLSEALKTLYSLIWDDFCSWYLEWTKPRIGEPMDAAAYRSTLDFFQQLIQLLHPYMPFITEELYHLLANRVDGDDLCIKQFKTESANADIDVLSQGEFLKAITTEIRNLKIKDSFTLYITTGEYELLYPLIRKMTKAAIIKTIADQPVVDAITILIGKITAFVQSENAIDAGIQKEELLKELKYQMGFLESINKKLDNERFVQNAKAEVVDLERKKKMDAEAKIMVLEKSLRGFTPDFMERNQPPQQARESLD
jgi:valyl-tRNA synthetase